MPATVNFEIQELCAEDAPAYNAFLLQGVLEHPDSLRIGPGDIARAPFRTERGPEQVTLLARDAQGAWLGVVTLEREQGREKRRHVAWVLRMYVRRASGGQGIGRALLRAAMARARALAGVSKLNLTVAEHNARALALYESEGFVRIGREPDAFRDPEPRNELTLSVAW